MYNSNYNSCSLKSQGVEQDDAQSTVWSKNAGVITLYIKSSYSDNSANLVFSDSDLTDLWQAFNKLTLEHKIQSDDPNAVKIQQILVTKKSSVSHNTSTISHIFDDILYILKFIIIVGAVAGKFCFLVDFYL